MATVIEETLQTGESLAELSIEDKKTTERADSGERSDGGQSTTLDAKQRKKLDKLIDGVLKRASSQPLTLVEDKYYALAQKYLDQVEAGKKLQESVKTAENATTAALKQRDQIQNEYTKSLLAQTKLEGICRELQRLHTESLLARIKYEQTCLETEQQNNKKLKEENINRCKAEHEERSAITTIFQSVIDNLNQQVSSNTKRNEALTNENTKLAEELNSLKLRNEKQTADIEAILKQKDSELQEIKLKYRDLIEHYKREKERARKQIEVVQHCQAQLDKIKHENVLEAEWMAHSQKEDLENGVAFEVCGQSKWEDPNKVDPDWVYSDWGEDYETPAKTVPKILTESKSSHSATARTYLPVPIPRRALAQHNIQTFIGNKP